MTDLNHKRENKIRVAGYIRVKRKMDYDHQVEGFTHQIRRNPEYQLVEVFTDIGYYEPDLEGITGLIRACEAGKIDEVIVKSKSNFIPDVTEAYKVFKKLKELGVEVQFQWEGYDTKNDIFMTLLEALAKAEQKEKIMHEKRMRR